MRVRGEREKERRERHELSYLQLAYSDDFDTGLSGHVLSQGLFKKCRSIANKATVALCNIINIPIV